MGLSVRRIINSIDYRLIRPLTGRDAKNWSSKTDFRKTSRKLVKTLSTSHSSDETMKVAGGRRVYRLRDSRARNAHLSRPTKKPTILLTWVVGRAGWRSRLLSILRETILRDRGTVGQSVCVLARK